MKTRSIFTGQFCRGFLLAALCLIPFGTGANLFGQQGSNSWALKMFTELNTEMSHNFGNVALHAETVHRFTFKNIYKEDVVLASDPTSNCSCTKPSAPKKVIKSGETAEIIAQVDTSGRVHTGQRKATVTVRFSKPRYAEVQLHVAAFIRSDVIIEPGVVEFGGIGQGKSVSKKIYLQYNGNKSGWSLTGLKNTDTGVKAVAQEVPRQNGRKTYEVTVTLKDSANSGYVNDQLRFTTNEPGAGGQIFIPVRAQVLAPLSAKPSYFQLGVVHPGEQVSKNLVIRGSSPFRIEKITSTDTRMKFLTANQESVVHVIPVTFRADENPGAIHQMISIRTSQKEMPEVDISVFGFISEEPAVLPSPYRHSANETMSFADQSPKETSAQPLPADDVGEEVKRPKLNSTLPLPGRRPKPERERIAFSQSRDEASPPDTLTIKRDAGSPAPLKVETNEAETLVSRPVTMTLPGESRTAPSAPADSEKERPKSDGKAAPTLKTEPKPVASDGWEAAPSEPSRTEKTAPSAEWNDGFEAVAEDSFAAKERPATNVSSSDARPLFQKPVLVAERPAQSSAPKGDGTPKADSERVIPKTSEQNAASNLSESLLRLLPD